MLDVADIKNVINDIKKHYDKHINNKYVKNLQSRLDITQSMMQNMNFILSGNIVYIDSRGAIEDLYNAIKAICDYITEVQSKIVPNISFYAAPNFYSQGGMTENDKILAQMAIKSFPMNVRLLYNFTYKLFNMVHEYDLTNFSKDPAYKRVETFPNIEKLILDLKKRYLEQSENQ